MLIKCRSFVYQLVSLLMVGVALYVLAQVYTLFSDDPVIKYTKKCLYCRKQINRRVSLKQTTYTKYV